MQLMPATAKYVAKKIGMSDYSKDKVNEPKTNIALGTNYLKMVLNDLDGSQAMASAAYNAGPTAINKMRNEASQQGRDPNRWFGQVEVVVGKELGMETVRYVRNIVKYYVAYRQLFSKQQARQQAKTALSTHQGS